MDEIRTLDNLVEEASRSIRLFFHVSPKNLKEQRIRFLNRPGRDSQPVYNYPTLEFDAEDLLGRLRSVGFPDGEIGRLYRDKCRELAETIKLLQARGSKDFQVISEALYGRPPAGLVEACKRVLSVPREAEQPGLNENDVKKQLEAQIENYRRRYPDFMCEVQVDPRMSANMYVSGHVIHIRRGLSISEQAAACDRFHEIDAHILTHLNGLRQPCKLLGAGLRGYLAFQESLGVFSEIVNRAFYPGRAATLCARVVAVDAMVRGLSFHDVFSLLTEEHSLDREQACTICQRVYRGGGFTKDWLYLSRLEAIFDYLSAGGDLGLLLLGKVTLEEVACIGELVREGVLQPPVYLPGYLGEADLSGKGLQELMDWSGLFSAE